MDSPPREIINPKFPKIVHLMYFPWNKNGKLKENELDFDKVFYNSFKENNSDWEVKLWTLTDTKKFVETNYPKYSNIFDLIKHPVQTVDFCRLLVTYHYGGIYWQYGSKQKVSLNTFIPPLNKKARLFVELIIPNLFSQYRTFEKLRDGKPEELIRVATQVFSCFPKNIHGIVSDIFVAMIYNLERNDSGREKENQIFFIHQYILNIYRIDG